MTFPDTTQVGDLFFMNDEPVRISAWNYTYKTFGDNVDYYFDFQFISIMFAEGEPAGSMVLIPMGYDFYYTEIREMTPLEKELWW